MIAISDQLGQALQYTLCAWLLEIVVVAGLLFLRRIW